MLLSLGFQQGLSCPNVFQHKAKGIHTSVHGDDFTSEGGKIALDWFESEVAKHYEITVSPRLGPGPEDAKEGSCLNRIIRWCDGRFELLCLPRVGLVLDTAVTPPNDSVEAGPFLGIFGTRP